MGDFQINAKNVVTQSGSDEPVIASNVVFPVSSVSGTGHVLQVVQTVYTSPETMTCNNADVDTNFTGTITPQLNTSKILIFGHAHVGAGGNFTGYGIGLKRGSTIIGTPTSGGTGVQARYHSGWSNTSVLGSASQVGTVPFNFLDSPTTLSATTYKLFFRGVTGVTTLYLNRTSGDDEEWTSVLTLMEIGG